MKGVLIIKVKHVSFGVRNKFKIHLTSFFSPTIEHFYITWLVLLVKKGSFSHFKTLYEVTHPLENILHSIMKSLRVQPRGYQVSLFPHFPPQNKRLSVSWQQKNKFMESGREEMWQHVAPKTYALFFFTETIQSPSTVSSKTHMRWIMALRLAIILNSMCCCFEAQSALS